MQKYKLIQKNYTEKKSKRNADAHFLIFSEKNKVFRQLKLHKPIQEILFHSWFKHVDNKARLSQLGLVDGALLYCKLK